VTSQALPSGTDETGLAAVESTAHAGLFESALVVNEAESVEEALDKLARAARTLLAADSVAIVAWTNAATEGRIRAAAGDSPEPGAPVATGSPGHRAAASGVPMVNAHTVAVPLVPTSSVRLTFEARWRGAQTPEALDRATGALATLGGLTRMAYHAEAEHAAAHARARLAAVLESVGEGVFIESAEGRRINQAGREVLRIPDGAEPTPEGKLFELDGTPIPDHEIPMARAATTGESVPYRVRTVRRDGLTRIVEGTAAPVFTPDGEQIGTVTTIRDVTEEHARQLLTERLLEQLFEALPTAVAVAHPESGEIVSANAAFGALVGYEPDELVGSCPPYPWWADAPAPDLTALAATEERNAEALFRRSDGKLVPVDIAPFVVREEGGEPVAAVGLVTDLSEKRRFEQQIVQSGKLAAIGELAAGVAHEINNPLFAILGLVEFLLKDAEPGTKAQERLELIQQTGLEIKDVVRALLDFARERSDEFETVVLSDVLEQTVDLVQRTTLRKEIELVERYAPEPLYAHASAGQLKQIVLNLMTNAQQAMGETGTITIELEREGTFALIRVSDTGPGIPADVLDRIFDPFFTTKRELGGTGLGLSLSQSIAVGHGGTLVAASPPSGGAEFTFRLPLLEDRA